MEIMVRRKMNCSPQARGHMAGGWAEKVLLGYSDLFGRIIPRSRGWIPNPILTLRGSGCDNALSWCTNLDHVLEREKPGSPPNNILGAGMQIRADRVAF